MSVFVLATRQYSINNIQYTTRNSDVAISHSSPFSLLVNKPKAVRLLYSRPGLSSGAHMKALWLCFALVCFQCQTASGLPKRIPRAPAPGGQPAGLGEARPGARPGTAEQGRPSVSVQWMARPLGLLVSGGYAPYTCPGAAGARGNGSTCSQSCFFDSGC